MGRKRQVRSGDSGKLSKGPHTLFQPPRSLKYHQLQQELWVGSRINSKQQQAAAIPEREVDSETRVQISVSPELAV